MDTNTNPAPLPWSVIYADDMGTPVAVTIHPTWDDAAAVAVGSAETHVGPDAYDADPEFAGRLEEQVASLLDAPGWAGSIVLESGSWFVVQVG